MKTLLLISAVVLFGGLSLNTVARSSEKSQTIDSAMPDDDEFLPIGGAVAPATMVTKAAGPFLPGDVITFVGGRQARGIALIGAGEALFLRAGEFHRTMVADETDVGGILCMIFSKVRERSDARPLDVITSINSREFRTEEKFLRLAVKADTIQFHRGGIAMSRQSTRHQWSGQSFGNVKVGFGGGKLTPFDDGGGFELVCSPDTRGFCAAAGNGDNFCIPNDPGTYCPCSYCGGSAPQCCQNYQ